jgi:tRNA pseudouridine55 synthase
MSKKLRERIKENLKYFTGKFIQEYPMYSSRTVKGKALFKYARDGEDVEIPKHQVYVASIKLLKISEISGKKLLQNINKRIKKVTGDFRQEEILKIWHKQIQLRDKFQVADFKISCSSGTYVRGIVDSLGRRMKIPALAFSINRTKIGKWTKAR